MFDWATKSDLKDFATKNDLKDVKNELKDVEDRLEGKIEKLKDKADENSVAIKELHWRLTSIERVQYAVLIAILVGLAKMFFLGN